MSTGDTTLERVEDCVACFVLRSVSGTTSYRLTLVELSGTGTETAILTGLFLEEAVEGVTQG